MDAYSWTWDEVRSMPDDVIDELAQLRSIRNQLKKPQ
jgi:hypothetical protein